VEIKVSVIVPIYNVEQYIERCLESLAAQTFSDYEVIMVNDGTKDKSGEIAKSYVYKFVNFVYLEKENGGLGSARNFGILHAKGKYIAFVDSDDWVNKDYINKLYTACKTYDSDISMCSALRVWDDGKKKRFNVGFNQNELLTDKYKVMIKSSNVAWNKMYRIELFNDIKFPEDKMTYEDYACIPRLFNKSKRISFIYDDLYYYFWRQTSITNSEKIDRNILKAHMILENSELSECSEILETYFIRNILGSLIWVMLVSDNNLDEIIQIVNYGKQRYPNLVNNPSLKSLGNRKYFGIKLVLLGYYKFAEKYAILINIIWKFARNIIMRK
jgi:glycosyltransferase involved in cell wall biosynthesis